MVGALPLTPETKDFFNAATFKMMKKTTVFMSIGRGPTVKEDDLIKALKNKVLGGAVLDVFAKEPLDSKS